MSRKLLRCLLSLMVVGLVGSCTILKPDVTLPNGTHITGKYEYLWQDKAWSITMADGTKISFDNNNSVSVKALDVAGEAVKRMPVTQ